MKDLHAEAYTQKMKEAENRRTETEKKRELCTGGSMKSVERKKWNGENLCICLTFKLPAMYAIRYEIRTIALWYLMCVAVYGESA